MYKFKIYISLFFINSCLYSQNSKIESIPVYDEEGYSINSFNAIVDAENFLWTDSPKGLIKHAGSHKVLFPYNFPNNNEDIGISSIKEVAPNTIIGINKRGFFHLNTITGVLEWRFIIKDKTNYNFDDFTEDKYGNVWTTIGESTILKFNKNDSLEVLDLKKLIISKGFDRVGIKIKFVDEKGLFLTFGDKYYYYDHKTLEYIANFVPESRSSRLEYNHLSGNGTLFFSNTSGSYKINGESYYYKYIPEYGIQIFEIPKYYINTVERENGDKLVFSIEDLINKPTLYIFRKKNFKEFETSAFQFNYGITKPFFYKNRILVPSFKSLKIIDNNIQDFTNFTYLSNQYQKLDNVSFRTIEILSDGTLLAISNKGWFELKKGDTVFSEAIYTNKGVELKRKIVSNSYGLHKTNDSIFYLYGFSNYLQRINVNKKKFNSLQLFEKSNIKFNVVFDIKQMKENLLLLATDNGLFIFNENERYLEKYAFEEVNKKNIETIYLDKKNNELWVGLSNEGGLYKKNLTTREIIHFKQNSLNYTLVDDNLTVIFEDCNSNTIWVGTKNGLQKINKKSLNSKSYVFGNTETNYITGILEVNDELWLSSYNGIIVFNKEEETFKVFYQEDGLPDNEFNKKSFKKVNDHSLYFGGINGLVNIKPTYKLENSNKDKISLIEIKYFDEKIGEDVTINKNISEFNTISISEQNNYLFCKLAFNSPIQKKNVSFLYRFLGENQPWLKTNQNGELNFSSLPVGKNIIEIKGVNELGESLNRLKVKIQVTQKFYKNPYFLSFGILLVALLIVFYINERAKNLKKELQILTARARELRLQLNPHYTYNILNSLQSIFLLESPKTANNYIVMYANLIRGTINLNNQDYVTINEEITFFKNYLQLEKLRLDSNLNYSIYISPEVNQNQKILSLLIQPIIENAIIHGLTPKKDNRDLSINFLIQKPFLVIEIQDNGIGRAKALEGKRYLERASKSLGLYLINKRIQTHNKIYKKQKIYWEIINLNQNKKTRGTKVLFKFTL
ncbi:histidine kinase [Dokdonia ponticola]|uniref:Histidine kinase n=1 Tax=Dokdonia ponticola TaxID=2041041 RepID=A0ABV9I547_9FLAO